MVKQLVPAAKLFASAGTLTLIKGQAFLRALTASSTAALSFVRNKTWAVLISVSTTGIVLVTMGAGNLQIITLVASSALTSARLFGKNFALASMGTVNLSRTLGIIRTATSSAAITMARGVAKNFSVISTVSISLARIIGKPFSLASTATSIFSAHKSFGRVFSQSSSAAISLIRNISLTRQLVAVGAFTWVRTTSLIRVFSSMGSLTRSISVGRTFMATSFSALSYAMIRQASRTFNLVSTGTSAFTKALGLVKAVTSTSAINLNRVIGLNYAKVVMGTATLGRSLSRTFITSSVTLFVFLRSLGKSFDFFGASSSSMAKNISLQFPIVRAVTLFFRTFSMRNPFTLRRFILIPGEIRTFIIGNDNRKIIVEAEKRRLSISKDNRQVGVEAENRALLFPGDL
jgi:hypothetical protein